jgi:hypothetical protein
MLGFRSENSLDKRLSFVEKFQKKSFEEFSGKKQKLRWFSGEL